MKKKNQNRNKRGVMMYHLHQVLWMRWEKKARHTEKVIARLEDSNSSDDEDDRRKKLKKVIQENPPLVIFTDGLGIKTCQGCGKAITKEEQMYPSSMVIK